MTMINFMRHGATDWNTTGRFMSRSDLSLSEAGRTSLLGSRSLIARLQPKLVIISPARRCTETAETVLPASRFAECEVWDDLREIDFGEFEGETMSSLQTGLLAPAFAQWLDPSGESLGTPGGETWEQIDLRVNRVLGRLESLNEDALIIGHGYFNRAIIIRALTGLQSQNLRCLEAENGSLSAISNTRGYWRLEFHNSRSPLLAD